MTSDAFTLNLMEQQEEVQSRESEVPLYSSVVKKVML